VHAARTLVLLLVLAGCVPRDRSYTLSAPSQTIGNWRVEYRVDRVTGRPAPIAFMPTFITNNKSDKFLPEALLQITCFKGKPIVKIEFGLRVGAERNSTVAYRVDDRPGDEVEATFLPDHKTVMIEDDAAVAKLLDDLAPAALLLVRVNSLFAGRTMAEFRVGGAGAAMEPVLTQCPAVRNGSGRTSALPRRAAPA
jgi:hypothetical protein